MGIRTSGLTSALRLLVLTVLTPCVRSRTRAEVAEAVFSQLEQLGITKSEADLHRHQHVLDHGYPPSELEATEKLIEVAAQNTLMLLNRSHQEHGGAATTPQELESAILYAMRRKKLTRFAIYEAFMQHFLEHSEIKQQMHGHATAISPAELRRAADEYCRRLAIKMTEDGRSKVSYRLRPGTVVFGDTDEWLAFFSSHALTTAVRDAAPLRHVHGIWSFNHKSMQEYCVARDVVKTTVGALKDAFLTPDIVAKLVGGLKERALSRPETPASSKKRVQNADAELSRVHGVLASLGEERIRVIFGDASLQHRARMIVNLTNRIQASAIWRILLSQQEGVRDFVTDSLVQHHQFTKSLNSVLDLVMFGRSLHCGSLDVVAENVGALLLIQLPKRENGGTALHAVAGEGAHKTLSLILKMLTQLIEVSGWQAAWRGAKLHTGTGVHLVQDTPVPKTATNIIDALRDQRGRSALFNATMGGHTQTIQLLIEHGADVNLQESNELPVEGPDTRGWTPLHLAAEMRQLGSLSMLLDQHASVDIVGIGGVTALQIACRNGSPQIVKQLLSKGASVKHRDDLQRTPLLDACVKYFHQREDVKPAAAKLDVHKQAAAGTDGNLDQVIKFLLDKEADVNAFDAKGVSPLMEAAKSGLSRATVLMLDRNLQQGGATIDIQDPEGNSPLMYAARAGHETTVKTLLHHGADVNHSRADGKTALMIAAHLGHSTVVQALTRAPYLAAPNIAATDWSTALILTCAQSEQHMDQTARKRVVQLLVQAGVRVNKRGGDEKTALTRMCQAEASSSTIHNVLLQLLEAGAILGNTELRQLVSRYRFSPGSRVLTLTKSVASKEEQWLEATVLGPRSGGRAYDLKIGGVDTPIECKLQKVLAPADGGAGSLLMACAEAGRIEFINRMLDAGVSPFECDGQATTALHIAAKAGHLSCVKRLLQTGASGMQRNMMGQRAFDLAIQGGHVAVRRTIMPGGIEKDMEDRALSGTPLLDAIKAGKLQGVQGVLAQSGVDVNGSVANGVTPLMAAVSLYADMKSEQQVDIVRLLLSMLADVSLTSLNGCTALHVAAAEGAMRLVPLLVEAGIPVGDTDKQGLFPLIYAAQNGHADVITHLISVQHADANQVQKKVGRTALHWAAAMGQATSVEALLNAGAMVDLKETKHKTTALGLACSAGLVAVVKQLLHHKANVNSTNKLGRTPLIEASEKGHHDVIETLLNHGPSVEAVEGETQRNALMVASCRGFYWIVRLILRTAHGIIDKADPFGKTALYMACARGNHETVRELLNRGASVEAADDTGMTPLMVTARGGHVAVLGILLQESPAIEATDSLARTALIIASEGYHVGCMRKLIEKGADTTKQSANGMTALSLVCRPEAPAEKVEEALKLLLSADGDVSDAEIHFGLQTNRFLPGASVLAFRGGHWLKTTMVGRRANWSGFDIDVDGTIQMIEKPWHVVAPGTACAGALLRSAAAAGNHMLVDKLINMGVSPFESDMNATTALHLAAEAGNAQVRSSSPHRVCCPGACGLTRRRLVLQVVKRLLRANANGLVQNKFGLRPFDLAIRGEHVEARRAIIEKDFNEKAVMGNDNDHKKQPLLRACSIGVLATVKAEIKFHDERIVDDADGNGVTPLMVAARYDYEDIVSFLLDQKASVTACSNSKATALHMAAAEGACRAIRLLLKKDADVYAQDKQGLTPLIYAANNGRVDAIRQLCMDHWASIEFVQKADEKGSAIGRTALHWAAAMGQAKSVDVLLDLLKADDEALRRALRATDDKRKATPLGLACSMGVREIAQSLLKANSEINHSNKVGATPLIEAADGGHEQVVQLLLEPGRGALVDKLDGSNMSALMTACAARRTRTMRLLLDGRAAVDLRGDTGKTALLIACVKGYEDCVRVLIEHGASIDLADDNDLLPMAAARRHNDTVLVQTILHATEGEGSYDEGKLITGARAPAVDPVHAWKESKGAKLLRDLAALAAKNKEHFPAGRDGRTMLTAGL